MLNFICFEEDYQLEGPVPSIRSYTMIRTNSNEHSLRFLMGFLSIFDFYYDLVYRKCSEENLNQLIQY